MICAEKNRDFHLVSSKYSLGVYYEQKQKFYTAELKIEAIKAIEENSRNVSEITRQLGISIHTLSNWHNKAKTGTFVGRKQYSPDLVALLEENKKLKQHES